MFPDHPPPGGWFLLSGKITKTYGFFLDLWYDDKYHHYEVDIIPKGGRTR